MAVSLPGPAPPGRKRPLDAELNLVPFIDLLVCCICFLLLTSVWIQLASLRTQTGITSFAFSDLYRNELPFGAQCWLFAAFALSFAIKVPMVPLHTWLPDAHVEAPTAGSVILAGVLLKMGTYGFVRFSLPILPDATREFLPFALGLCVIGIIYGAMVAMVQKDWKRLVAYSS